jgi:glutaconyl-CoA/methylmalonyl-CoA decarboxylase subunit gamma
MKQYKVTVNGQSYDVSVEEVGGVSTPATRGGTAQMTSPQTPKYVAPSPVPAPQGLSAPSTASLCVKSPMPGTVISFKVLVGQEVKRGDVLLILEAMKMENEIVAPQAGKIVALRVPVGAAVNTSDPLVDLE